MFFLKKLHINKMLDKKISKCCLVKTCLMPLKKKKIIYQIGAVLYLIIPAIGTEGR